MGLYWRPLTHVGYQGPLFHFALMSVFQGAKTVHVRQNGNGDYTKRFATVIMLLRGDGLLCRLAVIFRGTGRVSKSEILAYHPSIVVLWQKKAWNDTHTQLQYDKLVLL